MYWIYSRLALQAAYNGYLVPGTRICVWWQSVGSLQYIDSPIDIEEEIAKYCLPFCSRRMRKKCVANRLCQYSFESCWFADQASSCRREEVKLCKNDHTSFVWSSGLGLSWLNHYLWIGFQTKCFLSFVVKCEKNTSGIGQSSTTNVSYLACWECFGATDVSRSNNRRPVRNCYEWITHEQIIIISFIHS